MNSIRLAENSIRKIVRSAINEALGENGVDKFTNDMNKLFSIVGDEIGGESIQDVIANYFFDFDKWDDESRIIPCRYSESGIHSLLYCLFNYDLICINKNFVDVKNSNVPDVAKLIKPYTNRELCQKVYDAIF